MRITLALLATVLATPALAQPVNTNGNQAINGTVSDEFDANGNANTNGNQANHGDIDDRFDDQRYLQNTNGNQTGDAGYIDDRGDNAVVNSNNTSSYVRQARRIPVATAYAAPLTSGFDTCLGSVTGGAQTGVFGISLGGTKRDENCERIKLSRELSAMGMMEAGCELLAQDVRVRRALEAAGRTCRMEAPAQEIPYAPQVQTPPAEPIRTVPTSLPPEEPFCAPNEVCERG